ncbi:MAG: hypothetical protein Q9207_003242 [Kuettlingeria erythrocarpa]
MARTMLQKAVPAVFIVLLSSPVFSQSSASGTLNVFLNYGCTEASVINPTVNTPVDTCLVTPGAYGIAVQILPPCSTGVATVAMYRDKSCANAVKVPDYMIEDNCYRNSMGGQISAVQFVCAEVAGGSVPTTTSTATFGSSLLPIASGAPFSGTGPRPTTPSSNDAAPTTDPTSSSSSPTDSNSVDGDGSARSGSGLSQRTTIALGVAIPVAAVLVALLAWWFPCKKGKGSGGKHHLHPGSTPAPIPSSHNQNWNPTPGPIYELSDARGFKYR